MAINDYKENGKQTVIEKNSNLECVFNFFKRQLDIDGKKYVEKVNSGCSRAGIISGIKRSKTYRALETDEEREEYLRERLEELTRNEQTFNESNEPSTDVQQSFNDVNEPSTDVEQNERTLNCVEQNEQGLITPERKLTYNDNYNYNINDNDNSNYDDNINCNPNSNEDLNGEKISKKENPPAEEQKPKAEKEGCKKSPFRPPALEEVRAYCSERNNGLDPERFVDFYQSKGWKVGNQPMRDWRAAIRTWEKTDKDKGKQTESMAEKLLRELKANGETSQDTDEREMKNVTDDSQNNRRQQEGNHGQNDIF
jgi:hypothetical protein